MKNRILPFRSRRTAAAMCLLALCPLLSWQPAAARGIDRRAVVTRHNPEIRDRNLPGPTQVGNGEFAFGFDISGLQTFSDNANTMSNWGWYRFPLPEGQTPEEFRGAVWETQGRMVRYDIPNPEQKALCDWMVRNPQRINLGRVGLLLTKTGGERVRLEELGDPVQRLDLWSGVATSEYTVEGIPVRVTTVGHPELDAVAVRIESAKVGDGSAGLTLRFPFPTNVEFSDAADWNSPGKHRTDVRSEAFRASFHRTLGETVYDVHVAWDSPVRLRRTAEHCYEFVPETGRNEIAFVVCFDRIVDNAALPSFDRTAEESARHWRRFWESGGAIDLSESSDPRWRELERRVVLSQYVMAVNEAGSLPPQESGLVNNGWYGKYHYEMIWWHCAHYALWNRWELASEMMRVFTDNLGVFRRKAAAQGYAGVRWPKTIGDHAWWEWPLETTALLIWQQPHPIFYAELEYRLRPTRETLEKWRDVVFGTADFMASYAHYDAVRDRYVLGYPLQVVGENADPRTTINPAFEPELLAYGAAPRAAVARPAGAARKEGVRRGAPQALPASGRRGGLRLVGEYRADVDQLQLGASGARRSLRHVTGRRRGHSDDAAHAGEGPCGVEARRNLGLGLPDAGHVRRAAGRSRTGGGVPARLSGLRLRPARAGGRRPRSVPLLPGKRRTAVCRGDDGRRLGRRSGGRCPRIPGEGVGRAQRGTPQGVVNGRR